MIYRYELVFDGEPQDTGLFQGLCDVGLSEKKRESLEDMFQELVVPELPEKSRAIFWFTESGNQKFMPALRKIQKAIATMGWELSVAEMNRPDENHGPAPLYEDSYQVAWRKKDIAAPVIYNVCQNI